RFVWRDEPVEASLTLGDFLAALNGERSGVKLRLSGAPAKVAFDGATSDQPTLKVEGTLSGGPTQACCRSAASGASRCERRPASSAAWSRSPASMSNSTAMPPKA